MTIQNIKIGLIQDGKLLNELIIDNTKDIYIGTGTENTITINEETFDTSFQLFSYIQNKYYLALHKSISGKIIGSKYTISLRDLVTHKDVIQRGDNFLFPLSDDTRGVLNLGENTLLFKTYSSESIPEKLPKEFRGGFFGEYFDLSFSLIFIILFTAYVLLAYSFGMVKPKELLNFEKIPEKFVRLIMDTPVEIKKIDIKFFTKRKNKKNNQSTQKTGLSGKQSARDSSKEKQIATIRPGGGSTEARSASEVVRSAGIIGVIGSKGKSGDIANLFQEQGFNTKLDKALKGVSGLYAGTSIQETKMKRGSGDATGIEIGSLKATTGSGAVAFGPQNTSASGINIVGDIDLGDIEGAGTINPAVIARTLAQHVGAFQYCYNKALQGNPRLKGELKVRFTILTDGSVDKNRTTFSGETARDDNLTSCIRRVFLRIKFPDPKGGEVTVNYPLNFTAQN